MTERPILIHRGFLFTCDSIKSWLWRCRICSIDGPHSYTLLLGAYAAAIRHLHDEHSGAKP